MHLTLQSVSLNLQPSPHRWRQNQGLPPGGGGNPTAQQNKIFLNEDNTIEQNEDGTPIITE